MSEAIPDWVTNVETTHYILGSVAVPHPYPILGPEHSVLKDEGLAEYYSVTDDEALEGMMLHSILHFRLHFQV